MPDILSGEARSQRMSRIRSADTKPELILRKALHAQGFRYVLSGGALPVDATLCFQSKGRVLPRYHGRL